MKLKGIIVGVAFCFPMAFSSQAAFTMSADWTFDNNANPASAAFTQNPLGISGAATITAGNGDYYSQRFLNGDSGSFGSRTGIWDIEGASSQIQLRLNAQPATPATQLTYQLQIDQFSDNSEFMPGAIVISPLNPARTDRSTLESPSSGFWYRDTYSFDLTGQSGPLTLTISPDPGFAGISLVIDQIHWSVIGDFTAVPEPAMAVSLTAAGLAGFALWRRRRREAANLR